MTTHPQQPEHNPESASDPASELIEPTDRLEAQIDALLAQAANDPALPADLEAKVLALTDTRMNVLLDEALAPEAAPNQLAEQIIAAITPGQATAQPMRPAATTQTDNTQADKTEADQPAVIGRITPATCRYAAAAVLLLAAGVGLWWANPSPSSSPETVRNDDGDTTEIVAFIDNVENADEAIADARFDGATALVDNALEGVAEQIDSFSVDGDSFWAEMDEYEAFLAEFENDLATPET